MSASERGGATPRPGAPVEKQKTLPLIGARPVGRKPQALQAPIVRESAGHEHCLIPSEEHRAPLRHDRARAPHRNRFRALSPRAEVLRGGVDPTVGAYRDPETMGGGP